MEVANSVFDLAVVGGGPAGTAASITAARAGARVALFDGSDFPRQKVCGEFVSAESLHLLRELLGDCPESREMLREAPAIGSTRLFVSARVIKAAIQPPALSIPRYRLDLLLWEAACRAGVGARTNCEVLSVDGQGPFSLATARGEVRAHAVVLCSGRWSRFSQRAGLPPGPKWIGVKAHFRERNPPLSTDLYFFDRGYCGVQPIGGDVVNVCAMMRSDRATSLAEVFQLSNALKLRAADWKPLMSAISTAPLLYREPRPIQGNIVLAGDAAGFIDPFAGDGISLALRSGQAAAQALQQFLLASESLESAVRNYGRTYRRHYAPLIAAAARVRMLVDLPESLRRVAVQALRVPGVMPYLIRKTRTR